MIWRINIVNYKAFLLCFIIVYILLSAMLGPGIYTSWVPEATFLQKYKAYVFEHLTTNFHIKTVISIIISVIFCLMVSKLKAKKSTSNY